MSRPDRDDADAIVVGAGPAGSATAYHLAQAGREVLLLEKTAFPREKVCGDGLTPRAVPPLLRMGIDVSPEAGWLHNKGLRIVGGGMRLHLDWPDLTEHPSYGLVRKRLDFDELLAGRAVHAGVKLAEQTTVTGPVHDPATGRVTGVTARTAAGADATYRAPVVVAADGNSSRLAVALGRHPRKDRPLGVAIRTYFESPRHDDDWLESWLEVWDGPPGRSNLLSGYGWVFGMGDGTSNVGLGVLNNSKRTDLKQILWAWLHSLPSEWQFSVEHQRGPIRGAALPMGFNRRPHYHDGVLLVGDAGGLVNPFNGEGIAYAMESGEVAAEIIAQALDTPGERAREQILARYPKALQAGWGGYYTLGRLFVRIIGHPQVMKLGTRHALPRPTLMRFTLKLLANLTEPRRGDAMDRVINALCKLAPAA